MRLGELEAFDFTAIRSDHFSAEIIGLPIFILEELTTRFPVAKSMTPHTAAAINAPRMKPKKLPCSSSAIFPSTFVTRGPPPINPIINNCLLIRFPHTPLYCFVAEPCQRRGDLTSSTAQDLRLVILHPLPGRPKPSGILLLRPSRDIRWP